MPERPRGGVGWGGVGWGGGRPAYPCELLAELLPLLTVGAAQLLLVAGELAQSAEGPGGQGLGVLLQELRQSLRLGDQRPPALREPQEGEAGREWQQPPWGRQRQGCGCPLPVQTRQGRARG